MSASPASKVKEDVSLPCSLPSTPVFPPLTETLSQVTAKSGEEEEPLENRTGQLQEHAKPEAHAEGNLVAVSAEGQGRLQREQPQAKKDGLVLRPTSDCKVEGYPKDKAYQRKAPTRGFGPTGMPSSLLRPLDHEEERKLLQLEQQFRKERMEALRRQNALRRRRLAEKQQRLRAAAAREQAAALENRHQKLQAARILMERGLAAAAASASVDAAAAANQSEVTSTAAHALDHSSSLSTADMTSAVVAPTAPAISCHPRERAADIARLGRSRPALFPLAASDSLPICHATCNPAPSPAARKKNVQQRSAQQHCARGHTDAGSSEHSSSGWSKEVNFSHARISMPRNSVNGTVATDATDAGYTCFPDESTVAECVVAGAAVRYTGALSSPSDCQSAGSCGYHCQAAQEILSLWPCSRRPLLNGAVDNSEGLVLLPNQNINRLVLAASITSHQRAERICCNPYSSAVPSCDKTPVGRSTYLRRINAECKSLPPHPPLRTSETHPAPTVGRSNRRRTRSSSALFQIPTCCPPKGSGQSEESQQLALGSLVITKQTESQQQQHQRRQRHQQQDSLQQHQQRRRNHQQQCQNKDHPPPRQQDGALDLQQSHPPAQEQQHQPNQSQAASNGCLTEYGDIVNGKICSSFNHARQAAQSQTLQIHCFSPPTLVGVPLTVFPGTQHDEQNHQRHNMRKQPINNVDISDCSPCESTASSATTGSAKHVVPEQCPPKDQEQQVQLQKHIQQQHEGLQKKQKKNQPHQQQLGLVAKSSTARESSYAGQFAVASRAKVGEAQQRRRKRSQEAQNPDCDISKRPPAGTVLTEAPVSASSSGSDAAGASACPTTCSPPTDRLSISTALPVTARVSTPCGPHVAVGSVVPVRGPSTSGRSAITAIKTPQVGECSRYLTGNTFRQHGTSRSFGRTATTLGNSSHGTSQRQQLQQSQQQQRHSHQLNQSEVRMVQNQGSHQSCTGVQVVNRKLKALIEQQLQYTIPNSSNVVTERDRVSCFAAVAKGAGNDSQNMHGHEKLGHGILKEAHVEEREGAAASLAAKETRAFNSTIADGECMLLQQRSSCQPTTPFSQSLSVTSTSMRQHLQHPEEFSGDNQAGQAKTLHATEQLRYQCFDSQLQQQHQFESTEECAECVAAVSCRLHISCEGRTLRDYSDSTGGNKRCETQGEYLVNGTVHDRVVDNFHRSDSEAEDGSVVSVNNRTPCGQCAKKALSMMEEQGEYMRSSVQRHGSVRPVENAENGVQQGEEREASALLAVGEDSPSNHSEQDVHSVQALRECASKKPDLHTGKQREEEGTKSIPSSLYNSMYPRIIRVRPAAALDTKDVQEQEDSTIFSGCKHSERFKKLHLRRKHLPQERGITCQLSAGLAVSTRNLEHSESDDETEKEETGEEQKVGEEFSQPLEIRRDAKQATKVCNITGKGSPIFEERTAEDEYSRSSSVLFAPSSGRQRCSASCSSSTCLRTSTARDDTATTLSDKSCADGTGVRGRKSARAGASETTRSSSLATESNSRRAADCATVDDDRFSVRCTLRNMPLVRAAGDSLSGRKGYEACSDKGINRCGAAYNSSCVCRQHAHGSSNVPCEQQQEQQSHESMASSFSTLSVQRRQPELHRHVVSTSPVYPLQENQRAGISSSQPSGLQQPHFESIYANDAPQQPQQFETGPGMREMSVQRQLTANLVSPASRCFCCLESGLQRQHRLPQYGNDNAVAEHETTQVKQRITPCAKQETVRCTNIPLNPCNSGRSCRTRSKHAVACDSGTRHCTLAVHNCSDCINSDIPCAGTCPHSSNNRSSSGDRSSSNSSTRGSEHLQRSDRCMTTSSCQEGLKITLSTAKREKECGCASASPCMPVASQSCSRLLRTVNSTSALRGKRESRRAVRCSSNKESCRGASKVSKSNSCSSTCCGSAGDSVDSSTLCCTLSHRTSSKLCTCEFPAQKTKPCRDLSTQPTTKAPPKKRDIKDLKLQALANAEKKVEERLLLLDVNQKTLDEQHERRRYLQQQVLQQQQQQLLEQQQQLQHQQLLGLVQYQSLSREEELNPRSGLLGSTEIAIGETTTQGAASGDRQGHSASNWVSSEHATATNSWIHSTNVLKNDHKDVDSSTHTLERTLCTLQPGIHQKHVPINSATSTLLPMFAAFAAFPSTPVMISLLPGPPPHTTPARGSLRARTLTPTLAPKTPPAPLHGNVSSRGEKEQTLKSKAPRPSRQGSLLKSARTATVFPRLPSKGRGAAAAGATAAPVAVTATATAVGSHEATDSMALSKTSKAAVTKSLQSTRRAPPTRALPPLRARSSSWTQRPQALELLPRNV